MTTPLINPCTHHPTATGENTPRTYCDSNEYYCPLCHQERIARTKQLYVNAWNNKNRLPKTPTVKRVYADGHI